MQTNTYIPYKLYRLIHMPSIRFSFCNFQSQIQRAKLSIVVTTRLLAIVNVAKDFNFRALKPI